MTLARALPWPGLPGQPAAAAAAPSGACASSRTPLRAAALQILPMRQCTTPAGRTAALGLSGLSQRPSQHAAAHLKCIRRPAHKEEQLFARHVAPECNVRER